MPSSACAASVWGERRRELVEVGARDALQPALLDRLTDHDPTRKVEGRDERVLSRAQLRASVLRDLTWLFNSTNLASSVDLSAYPLAAESTLNYGLAPLAGNPVASLEDRKSVV